MSWTKRSSLLTTIEKKIKTLTPDHPHAQAQRLQALRLRHLREKVPEEGGPSATPRFPTRQPGVKCYETFFVVRH
jgi:hypothetical protein